MRIILVQVAPVMHRQILDKQLPSSIGPFASWLHAYLATQRGNLLGSIDLFSRIQLKLICPAAKGLRSQNSSLLSSIHYARLPIAFRSLGQGVLSSSPLHRTITPIAPRITAAVVRCLAHEAGCCMQHFRGQLHGNLVAQPEHII